LLGFRQRPAVPHGRDDDDQPCRRQARRRERDSRQIARRSGDIKGRETIGDSLGDPPRLAVTGGVEELNVSVSAGRPER
jgi:hypothetical protein